ncbi:MAG: hypothetical protein F2585_12415 [Actinobacteria bacterium]|nr:hypothetical protein [Actinomycetota bacterium]
MRGVARTPVEMNVGQLRPTWATFTILPSAKPLSRREEIECEEYWQSLGLSGAVMVVDLRSTFGQKLRVDPPPIQCNDWRLTANVTRRIRDGFLHTRFPLLQHLDGETHRWATDDRRLVELVQSTQSAQELRKETEQ